MNNTATDFLARFEEIKKRANDIEKPAVKKQMTETKQKEAERWMVYSFSVPVKFSSKIAFGFESKELAQQFIKERMKDKVIETETVTYHIRYGTMLESRDPINVFDNNIEVTNTGNDREIAFQNWIG